MLTAMPNIPAKKTRVELLTPVDFLIKMLHTEPQTAHPSARATPV
jgi:hypothetical protein